MTLEMYDTVDKLCRMAKWMIQQMKVEEEILSVILTLN